MATINGNNANNGLAGTNQNDRINGKGGNDVLTGGRGNDVLIGGSGNDILFGGGGDDRFRGGHGNDIAVGHAGRDVFELHTRQGSLRIIDYQVLVDRIEIRGGGRWTYDEYDGKFRNDKYQVFGEIIQRLSQSELTIV